MTNSIDYIASVSLISLAICYIIGCLAFVGLRQKYPNINRPYKAPLGYLGVVVTVIAYICILIFADKVALLTAAIVAIISLIYAFLIKHQYENKVVLTQNEIGEIEVPTNNEKKKIDHEYFVWKYSTIVVSVLALAIYLLPIVWNR